jgi:hypothetical protein
MSLTNLNPYRMPVYQAVAAIEHVLLPVGGACVIEGPPGASKTSQLHALQRRLQDANPNFGAASRNCSNMQYLDMAGTIKIDGSPLSTNGVPLLLQPNPGIGLRGAFPIICPEHLRHPDAEPGLHPDNHYDGTLTYGMLQPYDTGIMVFDDFTKAPDESVFASFAQWLEEGCINQWGVPVDGWVRVGVCNAVAHGSHDMRVPAHTRNRVLWINVYCSIDDVAPYWRSMGMHPDFIAFAAAESKLVLSEEVPMEQEQFCTARSWMRAWQDATNFCQFMAGVPDKNVNDAALPYEPVAYPVVAMDEVDENKLEVSKHFSSFIAGRCGGAVATKFHDFLLHMNERPTMEQILADPFNAKVPNHSIVVHSAAEMILTHGKVSDIEPICDYMTRLPKPVAAVWCGQMAAKHAAELLRSKPFSRLTAHCGAASRIALFQPHT